MATNHYAKIETILENENETNKWNKKKYFNNFRQIVEECLKSEAINHEKKQKWPQNLRTTQT